MAISEIPSLHLKPVAYKTNKLYLKLPEGSIGNMTFARTSVATRLDKNGLVEEVATGIPRLDYTNDSCPELLLEPTRTNICLRSEEFEHSLWIDNAEMTVTANTNVSPDGTKTADKIVFNSSAGAGIVTQNITVANTTNYELSIYIKGQKGGEKVQIDFKNSSSSGTSGTEVTLTKDWVRYTENLTSTATDRGFQIRSLFANGNSTFYVWGSQMELSDYGTTYIKTIGSSVTRATETLNTGGDNTTFNSLEGVLYCEISALFNDLTSRAIAISDGTTSNRLLIFYNNNTNQITANFINSDVTQASMSYTLSDITNFSKVALKWKVNDFALWIDGIERSTDSLGSVPSANTFNSFGFDNGAGTSQFLGITKEVKVFKTALTDAELKELTT